jgi:hypothetical protein
MGLFFQEPPGGKPQYQGVTGLPGDRYSMKDMGGTYTPSNQGWGWDPETGNKTYNGNIVNQKADEAYLKSIGVPGQTAQQAQALPIDPMKKLGWQEMLKNWKSQQQPINPPPTTTARF